jgi:hypothetical protein
MKVLEKHEGLASPLLEELKTSLKHAYQINLEKAERDALKALKSFPYVAQRLKEQLSSS